MAKSKVAVLKVKPQTILSDTARLCELAGMKDALAPSATTFLKDNISWHYPFPGANTTPWQLEGTILALRGAGYKDVTCVQNKTVVTNAFKGEDLNHYIPLFKKYDIPVLYNFKDQDMKWVEYRPKARMHVLHDIFPDGIMVPDYFFGKNVVHLPTVKCHIYTTTTGAMKNAFGGLLNTHRHYTHTWIHKTLVDLLAIQKEIHSGIFAIMDGTTAGNGPGPRTMFPVVKDYMLASADQVAIDAVAAKMMGFDPMSLEFIKVAHDDGLGVGDPRDIEIVGDDVSGESWGFSVGDNGASKVGDFMWFGPMKRFQKLFFHTPLVNVFVTGSEAYHDFYRWPLKDKHTFEHWKATTQWGRLFDAYARGEADRTTGGAVSASAPLVAREPAASVPSWLHISRATRPVRDEIRETLRLAVPIAFAQVALMTMGLVDAAIVGRVSEVDLAAVSLGNSLTFAAVCPAMGVTMAVEPLASQAIGAGDGERAWTSLRAGLLAVLVLSVPTMALAYLSTLALAPLGVDPAIIEPTRRFVLARLPGVPGWLFFMAGKSFLEAKGLTRPLLVGGWVANVVNLVVCSVLVLGDRATAIVGLAPHGLPQLGSFGAGFATSFSNSVLAAIALASAWAARPAGARLVGLPDEVREAARKVLSVGMPIGFQFLTEVGVFSLVGVLSGRLGARVAAAHQIAIGLASFTFMGVLGISAATAVRVGRAIGAAEPGGPRRAGFVGVAIGATYMALSAGTMVAFARPLASLFTQQAEVLALAVPLLGVAAVFQIFDGVQGVSGGALRGATDTRFASWANIACHWCIGLPLALLFGFQRGNGVLGLWWGLSVGLCVVAVVLFARFAWLSARPIAAA